MRPRLFFVKCADGGESPAGGRPSVHVSNPHCRLAPAKVARNRSKSIVCTVVQKIDGGDSIALHGVLHRTTCAGPKSIAIDCRAEPAPQPGHRAECIAWPVGGCRLLDIHPSPRPVPFLPSRSCNRHSVNSDAAPNASWVLRHRRHWEHLSSDSSKVASGIGGKNRLWQGPKAGSEVQLVLRRVGGAVCSTQVASRSVLGRPPGWDKMRRPEVKGGCSSPNAYCDGRGRSYRALRS